jgi:uracil-DNA glycosylase family 4
MTSDGTAVRDAAAAVRRFLAFQHLVSGERATLPGPAGDTTGRVLAYETLRARTRACTGCKLSRHRTRVVFSSGNPLSEVVFIGDAPGPEDDLTGVPFAGEAGELLDNILGSISLDRRSVCIINLVKCSPPEGRRPLPQEIQACAPILQHQLALLRPKLICSLGPMAAQSLLGTTASLDALRNRWHRVGAARLIATYHPATLLKSEQLKKYTWKDVQKLQRQLARMTT